MKENQTKQIQLNNLVKQPLQKDISQTRERKLSFEFRYNNCKSAFRLCCLDNKIIMKAHNKMINVLSFENIVKLTKTVKLMKLFLFEDYQRNIFKFCPIPLGKFKGANVETFFNQNNSCNPIDVKISNFIDSEKERFDWSDSIIIKSKNLK